MISAITPLVQVASRRRQWWSAFVAYGAGSITASALIGGLLGLLGQLAGGPWFWGRVVLLIVALGLGLGEMGILPQLRPRLRRQTCKHWRMRYGPSPAALLWGIDIGLGLTTRVTFASYWILVVAGLLLANPAHGALLLGGYGLGRTVLVATGPLLIRSYSVTSIGMLLLRTERAWHRLHGWALFTVVGLLLLLGQGQ